MRKYQVSVVPYALLAMTVAGLFTSACSRGSEPSPSTETVHPNGSDRTQSVSPEIPDSEVDASALAGDADAGATDVPDADAVEATPIPAPPRDDTSGSVVPSGPMPFRGVNLAGGEFGAVIPGVEGVDYTFPTNAEIDYFASKGMNTFRIGFLWERLQPTANGELVASYAAHLDALLAHATEKKDFTILDPHNFARYYGNTVGSASVPNSVFADFWRRLALRYKDNPYVMFNLVNEPHDISTEAWVSAANAAIAAIRAAGAKNTILVPGNGWTGAANWTQNWYGTSNAVAMLRIVDPLDNMLFEVHQYLDANSSGGGACVSATIGSERIKDFVGWLRENGKKGFLGEFAGINSATCQAAVTNMLTSVMENTDVLTGWLWWAAGPAWGDYSLSIEPKNGADRPQMNWLTPFLPR